MNDTTKAKAEEILFTLSKQSFDDFYKGPFEDFITGVTGDKNREEILEDITYFFNLNN